jgi:hypothetical protein
MTLPPRPGRKSVGTSTDRMGAAAARLMRDKSRAGRWRSRARGAASGSHRTAIDRLAGSGGTKRLSGPCRRPRRRPQGSMCRGQRSRGRSSSRRCRHRPCKRRSNRQSGRDCGRRRFGLQHRPARRGRRRFRFTMRPNRRPQGRRALRARCWLCRNSNGNLARRGSSFHFRRDFPGRRNFLSYRCSFWSRFRRRRRSRRGDWLRGWRRGLYNRGFRLFTEVGLDLLDQFAFDRARV